MDHDPVLDAVGPRLRSLRQRRGTTLAELSEATGISVSTLSRLESGGRKPTLELLLALARAHQVPLDELVGAAAPGDPRVRARPVHRNGRTLIPLSQRPGGIRAYKLLVPAGEPAGEQKTHEGYEWMYVLSEMPVASESSASVVPRRCRRDRSRGPTASSTGSWSIPYCYFSKRICQITARGAMVGA